MVDEDAGELVADRLVDQHRRDRGIDAAGEAADHPALADLARIASRASARNAAIVQSLFRPATLWTKLPISRAPSGVCDDFGVEHQAVVAARLVGDQRERRVLRDADALEAGRQAR